MERYLNLDERGKPRKLQRAIDIDVGGLLDMDGIIKILPVVKDYAWGNDFYIADLLGLPHDGPKAELWIGAHKSGSSIVDCACGACNGCCCSGQSLVDYIDGNPSFLGIGDSSKFPFLLKILAIGGALSIQCHPDKVQAAAGYEAERKNSGSNVVFNYQDPNPKAEMLYALTPVTFMCGFRPFEDIEDGFLRVAPNFWNSYFSKVGSIADFFHTLYRLPHPAVGQAALEVVGNKGLLDEFQRFVFDEIYPKYSDPGILAPLFLNVVRLEPGQAVYLKPDIIHAYVFGNGVELMNNSDNVLRAGLTSKHMDVDELERIMSDEPYIPSPMKSACSHEGVRFATPDGFALTVMDHGRFSVSRDGAKLFLCTEGSAVVGDLELSKGQCCIAGASAQTFEVDASNGCVFMASN